MDALDTYTIPITEGTINNGEQGCGDNCPIALGICSHLGVDGSNSNVEVGATRISFTLHANDSLEGPVVEFHTYNVYDALSKWIRSFDKEKMLVAPIKVKFDVIKDVKEVDIRECEPTIIRKTGKVDILL